MEKEEHCGTIYAKNENSELVFLWNKLVSSFDFTLIKYEIENVDDSNKNDYFYEQKFIKKIYETKPNEKVIYHDFETQTLIIIKNSLIFDNIYAVRDELEVNRYFIGFSSYGNYTNISTLGIIVYFDNEGKLKNKNILNQVLSDNDSRNSKIITSLYNQSLIFTQIHRDSGVLMMNLVLLSYDDTLISKHHFYFDKIIPTYKFSNNKYIINKRFLQIKSKETNYLFDMGSLRIEPIKNDGIIDSIFFTKYNNQLIINSYKLSEDEIEKFTSNFSDDNEYYGDGYPNNCIQCGELTFKANYSYAFGKYSYSHMGLGKAYCHNCQIRFSKTDQKWVCCKIINTDNYMCNNTVTKDNMCNLDHSNIQIIVNSYGEQSLKFPYKKELNLTLK